MEVYIASALKNHIINTHLEQLLIKEGISCFLPQNQAYSTIVNDTSIETGEIAKSIFQNNLAAINESRVVVVISHQIGTDTSWECGYSIGLGKPVILIELESESIEEMYMVSSCINSHFRIKVKSYNIDNLRSLVSILSEILKK